MTNEFESLSTNSEENEEVELESEIKKRKNKKTRIEQDLENINYSAKELISLPENSEFKKVLQNVIEYLSKMHFLEESKVQDEINKFSELTSFPLNKNITNIKEYLSILDKIQIAKDRISTLYQQALSQNNFVETLYSNLFKVWTGKYSKLSSDKRREGEADLILNWMWITKIERKNIVSSLKIFHDNLISKSETVSRKITVHQESNKISGNYIQHSPASSNFQKNENKKYLKDDEDV